MPHHQYNLLRKDADLLRVACLRYRADPEHFVPDTHLVSLLRHCIGDTFDATSVHVTDRTGIRYGLVVDTASHRVSLELSPAHRLTLEWTLCDLRRKRKYEQALRSLSIVDDMEVVVSHR